MQRKKKFEGFPTRFFFVLFFAVVLGVLEKKEKNGFSKTSFSQLRRAWNGRLRKAPIVFVCDSLGKTLWTAVRPAVNSRTRKHSLRPIRGRFCVCERVRLKLEAGYTKLVRLASISNYVRTSYHDSSAACLLSRDRVMSWPFS